MRKSLLVGGLAISLTFGGLAGCGDGVDQDNGVSDGKQKDAIDNDTQKKAEDAINNVEDALTETEKDIEKKAEDAGIGDGIDQDNGTNDGEVKDKQ
ncbi:hypothetical protein [Neobacillus sp. FSL H8-0543]|uniref:hypothetical protein n=1 Tax=Neobacillus sp. FSL H8-0543 TaxID=2954672 RepID=UPI0031584CEC